MSFRSRLRFFVAIIVVLPVAAMAAVIFPLTEDSRRGQTDASLDTALDVAASLYDDARSEARDELRGVVRDDRLEAALRRRDRDAAATRLRELVATDGAIVSAALLDGPGSRVAAGSPRGVAAATAALATSGGEALGMIVVSTTDGSDLAAAVERRTGRDALVLRGGRIVGRAGTSLARVPEGSANVESEGRALRSRRTEVGTPAGTTEEIAALAPVAAGGTAGVVSDRLLLGGVLLGFLAVALGLSALVSRGLHAQIEEFLGAARRLARGRFDQPVSTTGDDAFAQLGREFNSMSDQLEDKISELERRRAELQQTIRRVGRAFATGLDPHEIFELAVQTAVDACEADCGRGVPLDPRIVPIVTAGADDPACLDAIEEAERRAVAVQPDTGRELLAVLDQDAAPAQQREPVATHCDGVHTLSMTLRARLGRRTHVSYIAVVSLARAGSPFGEEDAEQLSFLAGQAVVSIENADLHETVRRQAVTDELTGLANLREMHSALDREFGRGRRHDTPVAFLLLDIDNFKRVNDTFGHQQGDEVIQNVARLLREASRDIDEPARYGGEELAVVLPQTDLQGAVRLAERARASIESLRIPLLSGEGELSVTASFGVASVPSSASEKSDLIAAADEALYRAKRGGKNRVETAAVSALSA